MGHRPGRPDPLDLLAAGRGPGGDRPDGSRALGPRLRGRVIHLNYAADVAQSDAEVEADARRARIGDLPMKIHKVTRWTLEAVLAERFQVGRVFLLGDAAHRHPPTGGLGLTSAIHDAQNLCWKAAVLAGNASPALLETYEAERRSTSATASGRWRTASTTSRSVA